MMTFVAHTDIVALKAFALGLVVFDWHPLPKIPALDPSGAGCAVDDHFPDQQVAACARYFLQSDPQPEG
jgi:hypothetical protein